MSFFYEVYLHSLFRRIGHGKSCIISAGKRAAPAYARTLRNPMWNAAYLVVPGIRTRALLCYRSDAMELIQRRNQPSLADPAPLFDLIGAFLSKPDAIVRSFFSAPTSSANDSCSKATISGEPIRFAKLIAVR